MKRPNVIVIMADQLKATALGLYGNEFCEAPSLERMAQTGVVYNNAYTPHPLCVPARISLWTSQYPHTHGARNNERLMPGDAVHAFKLWKQAGFSTGMIGKNHCFGDKSDLDLFDVWCEINHSGLPKDSGTKGMAWVRPLDSIEKAHQIRRNMPKLSSRIHCAATDYPLDDYSTRLISSQTIEFLKNNKNNPFALWVSFPDPHPPYEVPRKYAEMFRPEKLKLPRWDKDEFKKSPERNRVLHEILGIENEKLDDIYKVLGTYYAMIRFIDDETGRILDALEDLGLEENTIVVFCSDHGDFMGEHMMINKGGLFYVCLTRIPLLVSWPGHIKAGQTDESMVSLIDVIPTLLKLQGIHIPSCMQGTPLPTITDTEPSIAAFSEYGAGGPPFRMSDLEKLSKPYGRHTLLETLKWREAEGRRKMVRTKNWKYVHDPMGDMDELYDLINDPWELNNVIDNAGNNEVIAEMRHMLLDWSIKTEDSRYSPPSNSVVGY
jgi:arylsulfatase A-like enzyme